MTAPLEENSETGRKHDALWFAALFVVGCVLIFAGLVIRGLNIGSCPVMSLNQAVPCIHTFPGTDMPVTTTGDMVMMLGGVLTVSMLISLLHEREVATRMST